MKVYTIKVLGKNVDDYWWVSIYTTNLINGVIKEASAEALCSMFLNIESAIIATKSIKGEFEIFEREVGSISNHDDCVFYSEYKDKWIGSKNKKMYFVYDTKLNKWLSQRRFLGDYVCELVDKPDKNCIYRTERIASIAIDIAKRLNIETENMIIKT